MEYFVFTIRKLRNKSGSPSHLSFHKKRFSLLHCFIAYTIFVFVHECIFYSCICSFFQVLPFYVFSVAIITRIVTRQNFKLFYLSLSCFLLKFGTQEPLIVTCAMGAENFLKEQVVN